MRAAVLETVGKPIVVHDDVEIIAPRAGEVRVRVHFCGLCHSDYSVVSGAFPAPGPIIAGHEASGIALAEYVITPATGAVKIDADVPLDIACVIGCAVQAGVGAVLNAARVEAGATVLIQGLGGVGLATVQGARIAGATLIVASDPIAARREAAHAFGATHTIDPLTQDLGAEIMRLTANIGVDYAFETAGRAAFVDAFNTSALPIVGAPPLEEKVTINNAVIFASTEKKLCGCLLGSCNSPRDIPRLVALWRTGQLDLASMVTSRRPLSEINEGFADLAAGRGIRTVISI